MPFRRTYLLVLLLVPLVIAAFWQSYLTRLGTTSPGTHAHGIAAASWLLLVGLQSWSIPAGRRALHRAAGLALFVIVPAFTGAGLLLMQSETMLAMTRADPFHAVFGVPLAYDDLVSMVALLAFVATALAQRRRMVLHGAAMLSTVLLVLPPVLARIYQLFPFVTGFAMSYYLAQATTGVVALVAAWRVRGGRGPFLAAAGLCVFHSLTLVPIGGSPAWMHIATLSTRVPPLLLAALGAALALVTLGLAWKRPPPVLMREGGARRYVTGG